MATKSATETATLVMSLDKTKQFNDALGGYLDKGFKVISAGMDNKVLFAILRHDNFED